MFSRNLNANKIEININFDFNILQKQTHKNRLINIIKKQFIMKCFDYLY